LIEKFAKDEIVLKIEISEYKKLSSKYKEDLEKHKIDEEDRRIKEEEHAKKK